MSTFKDRRIYFQNIAHLSKLIGDGQTVNNVLRKSFFRINGELELTTAVLEGANFPCCVHFDFIALPSQPVKYVYRKTIINELLFLSKFDSNNGVADALEDALDEAYDAATEFISFMINDFETNGICGNLFHFELNQVRMVTEGPVLDNLIGWRVTFQDLEKAPEFVYDENNFYEL